MRKPNFQIKSESGETYWISRSIAVVVVPLFHCEGLTYVPLGIRSEKMALYPSHWGIPCGFLDWGESASEAARREVIEELGLDLAEYCFEINPQPDAVITDPNPDENDTVSLRFVVHCNVHELPLLRADEAEVTNTKWLEIAMNPHWKDEPLAFNHIEIMEWAIML